MYLGEIVELAPVDDLFEAPLHPYTQALLEAIPSPNPRGRRPRTLLQGELPSPTALPEGCRFHTRCPHTRPQCTQTRPALQTAGDGRQVACHFWREIQSSGTSAPATAAGSASPNLTRRLHLYRAQQNGGEQQGR
jgi:peptide/nickel transport system ATP-binding protein